MNRTERFWNRIAKGYDNEGTQYDEPYIEILQNYLKEEDRVFEFACGTGSLAMRLAGNVKEIQAMDISSKMIEIANTKAAEMNIQNIKFIHATLFDEQFAEESYDVIFACNILHLLPKLHKEIQRMYSLLKPGGILITDTVCLGENQAYYRIVLGVLSKLRLIPYIKFFKTKELDSLISDTGFKVLERKTLNNAPMSYLVVAEKI